MKHNTKHYRYSCLFVMLFLLFSSFSIIFVNQAEAGMILVFNARDSDTVELSFSNANFNTARNEEDATSMTSGDYKYVACYLSGGTYYFLRDIIRFDTSGIPDNATIESVTWEVVINLKGTGTQTIYVVNGFNSGSTAKLSDYDMSNWSYEHAEIDITSSGTQIFTFNQNLTNSINLTGNTTYYVIHSKDFNNVAPTDAETYVQMGFRGSEITVTYSVAGTTSELYDYCSIGDLTTDVGTVSAYKYDFFEGFYNIPITTTIRGIDIPISTDQYNYQSNPDQYYLNVNGLTHSGNANFTTYDFNYGYYTHRHYLLTFNDIDQTIENHVLNIAIGFKIGGDWGVWKSFLLSVDDVHGDYYKWIKVHSSEYYFQDGSATGNLIRGYDMPFRFWYDCFQQDLSDFVYDFEEDTVFISPNPLNNTLNFLTGDPVNYMVYSHDMTTQPYIHINKDGSNIDIIKMSSQLEPRTFTPLEAGSYNITLVRGGTWKAGKNFSVFGQTLDNYIYTIPASSQPFSTVRIYYNFTNAENYKGRIIVSTTGSFYDTTKYVKNFLINNNESGYKLWSPDEERKYWVFLAIVYPNNVSYQLDEVIHPCYYPKPNELTGYNNVWLGSDHSDSQVFEYSHNFVLWNVVIKCNGQKIANVGDKAEGTYIWYPKKAGTINATLELLTDEGYICLDYFTFQVNEGELSDSWEDDDNLIELAFDELFDEFTQWVLGIFLIFIGLLVPMLIAKKFEIRNFPSFVYIFTGGMFFAFDIYAGLFDIYTIIIFGFLFSVVIISYLLGFGNIIGTSGSTYSSNREDNESAKMQQTRYINLFPRGYPYRKKSKRKEKAKRRR